MGILHGSLVMRKIKFRTVLLCAGLNVWVDQIVDICLYYFKQGIDMKNSIETSYVGAKNWITESYLWGQAFGKSTEKVSSFDPYSILYYILVIGGIIIWLQIVRALYFAFKDYYNPTEVKRKKSKKYIYILIVLINIGIYFYLNSEVYRVL